MSYFAKPYYIIHVEWFDENLEKDEITFINKRRKDLSNIHDFFYRKSKNKIFDSGNLLNLDFSSKSKKKFTNNSSYNFPENYFLTSKEIDNVFKKVSKNILNFGISKCLFYSCGFLAFQ